MVTEVFTKKAWASPLQKKGEAELIATFKELFTLTNLPCKLQMDNSKEFINVKVQDYLKEKGETFFIFMTVTSRSG